MTGPDRRHTHLFLRDLVTLLLLISCSIFLHACGNKKDNSEGAITELFTPDKFDEDDFAGALQQHYGEQPVSDSGWNSKPAAINAMMQMVYQSNQYLPLWTTEAGNTDMVEKLLKDIEELLNDGMHISVYHIDSIPRIISRMKGKEEVPLADVILLDTVCTRAYIQASRDLLIGLIDPKRADSLWYHTNDTLWRPDNVLLGSIRERNTYPGLDTFRSKIPTYDLLRKEMRRYRQLAVDSSYMQAKTALAATGATDSLSLVILKAELPESKRILPDSVDEYKGLLMAYQEYEGLKLTGKADASTLSRLSQAPDTTMNLIRANLERIRWMHQSFEDNYILVNIPLMELMLYHDGQEAMHMNVIVGKNARQTPSLDAKMVNVVVNPPWGVPPTILKKDVLPGLLRSGKRYLDKKGLTVYDFKGNKVDPSQVNGSNYKRYVFRQPPGSGNALGYVKFNMPNIWNIYLHDTPHRGDFNKDDRALSSGCIRVQHPRDMAEYVLAKMNDKTFSQAKLDSLIKTQKTRYETLSTRPMVHIVYLTAFEDDTKSSVRFLRDFYKRDTKLVSLLQ